MSKKCSFIAEGANRIRVQTPYVLDDGDHLVIILKHNSDSWVLTDEGHTGIHLEGRAVGEFCWGIHKGESIIDAVEAFAKILLHFIETGNLLMEGNAVFTERGEDKCGG